jgi:V8-like Glu-specific endopeptidase
MLHNLGSMRNLISAVIAFAAMPVHAESKYFTDLVQQVASQTVPLNDAEAVALFEGAKMAFLSDLNDIDTACPDNNWAFSEYSMAIVPQNRRWSAQSTESDYASMQGVKWWTIQDGGTYRPTDIAVEVIIPGERLTFLPGFRGNEYLLTLQDSTTVAHSGMTRLQIPAISLNPAPVIWGDPFAAAYLLDRVRQPSYNFSNPGDQPALIQFSSQLSEQFTSAMARDLGIDPAFASSVTRDDWYKNIIGPWNGTGDVPCVKKSATGTSGQPVAAGSLGAWDFVTGHLSDVRQGDSTKVDKMMVDWVKAAVAYKAMVSGTFLVVAVLKDDMGSNYFFDGNRSLIFTNLPTMAKKLSDKHLGAGTVPICPADNSASSLHSQLLAEFQTNLSLGRCGGAMVRIGASQSPHFVTAAHCLENLNNPDYRVFLVGDFYSGAPGMNFDGRSFSTSDWIEITGRNCAQGKPCHPNTLDIAVLPLNAGEVDVTRLANLEVVSFPRVGHTVLARGFPLGGPRRSIGPENTRVRHTDGDFFWAEIDNFTMSSGSPVFDATGSVIGILVMQAEDALFNGSPGYCPMLQSIDVPDGKVTQLLPRSVMARALLPFLGP